MRIPRAVEARKIGMETSGFSGSNHCCSGCWKLCLLDKSEFHPEEETLG